MINLLAKFGLFLLACSTFAACSIPQVEDGKCTASRETVRSFYSQYLAEGERKSHSLENAEKIERFLTPELFKLFQSAVQEQKKFLNDPFTASLEHPTGFKVGECSVAGEHNVSHAVQLFWNTGDKPFQREMKAIVEKRGDKWLISDLISDQNESLSGALSSKDL